MVRLVHAAVTVPRQSAEVRRELLRQVEVEYWRRGNLRHLCLPGGQSDLYELAHAQPDRFPGATPLLGLCHRRFGKSHFGAIFCQERAVSEPGSTSWFTTDTTEHAREIVESMLASTMDGMPACFTFRTRRNTYYFRHKTWSKHLESRIILRGLNHNYGGSMRGSTADVVVVDEARDIKNLEYVVQRVIVPMFKGRKRPTLLMLTTPPDNMDHDVARVYYKRSKEEGALFHMPASKNPDWTEADDALMLAEYGSREALGYRIEVECELLPNIGRLVCPEWQEAWTRIVVPAETYVRPDDYEIWICADIAWEDHTGVVFVIVDRRRQWATQIDEIFEQYQSTRELAELVKWKINKLFPEGMHDRINLVADAKPDKLHDLRVEHGLAFRSAYRHDKETSIARFRSAIAGAGNITILDSCPETTFTLGNLLWNERRTDFERSSSMGHGDLFDAWRYLWRVIRMTGAPRTDAAPRRGDRTFLNPYDPDNWQRTGKTKKTINTINSIFGKAN